MNIELPGITNTDEKKEGGGQPFTLSVSKDGEIYFEDDKVAWKELEATLKAAAKREPGKRIVLRGDKGADYADVRRLYRAAQQVGFPGRVDEGESPHGRRRAQIGPTAAKQNRTEQETRPWQWT